MIQTKKAKGFRSLHSRLTLWVMLTVLAVFVLITIIITNVIRKALLSSSEENAKSRIEIANQHINSILVGVEVAVNNVIPEVMENLENPDQYYAMVQKILELNQPIIGSAIAFEPNYFPQKGEHFSPYAYRTVNDSICSTMMLGCCVLSSFSSSLVSVPLFVFSSRRPAIISSEYPFGLAMPALTDVAMKQYGMP